MMGLDGFRLQLGFFLPFELIFVCKDWSFYHFGVLMMGLDGVSATIGVCRVWCGGIGVLGSFLFVVWGVGSFG